VAVNRTILQQRTKFRKDQSNRCGDVAIFVIFQDGGRRHLGFSKIRNFNGRCVIVPNLIEIGQTVAEIWRFNGFFKMAAVAILGPIGTTHDDNLMVSIVVQNLVEIDAGVSIT